MVNEKEINFFKKNGYLIKKSPDQISLNKLQDFVFKILSKKKKSISKDKKKYFQSLHKYITKKELNNFRVNAITLINRNKNFRDLYYNSSKELLDGLVGNEIAMQKKINLSIQIPNDTKSMLPMHSDIYAGESPFEVVVLIPLMDVKKSTHSMFITNPKDNIAINKAITKSKKLTIIKIYHKFKRKI